jgi:hypothetical protein
MAAPNGDKLSKDKAIPYVVNFQMVDIDNNGSVSQDEGLDSAAGRGNRN